MNTQRIENLIKYMLAVASQNEDWKRCELGPIHIIKYLYLADMYYAKESDGDTYTGIDWEFYHFGPWNLPLYKDEIPNAVKNISAIERTFPSQYTNDAVRWSIKDVHPDEVTRALPIKIYPLLNRDIKRFSSDTYDLLHYVYVTPPITNARPGEKLQFRSVVIPKKDKVEPLEKKTTTREKKKRKERILSIREKIKQRKENKKTIIPTPPRYDEVFFNGVMEMNDDFSLKEIENHKGILQVSQSAWSKEWRKDRDLP
ncbi:MAG: hypothetical protein D3916_01250 [Candidatus Electrothrix sp. MAN1_4]|nr:hypothetical protein [Candidatus Electrothrix sp. MAN1_4]